MDTCVRANVRVSRNRNTRVCVYVCVSVHIHGPLVSDHVMGNVFLADSRRS